MNSKYGKQLLELGKNYKELLDLHLWVFSYFLMVKSQRQGELSQIADDIINKYHSYKTLSEYDKILGQCLEGVK